MTQPMSLVALAVVLFPPSLAQAETSPVAPGGRAVTGTASGFDLAIVGGDTKLAPVDKVGASGVTGTYTVTLKNVGANTITQQNVGCKLGEIEFAHVANSLTLAQGQQGTVVLTTTTPWARVPTGLQSIQCAASIAAPALARDGNSSNNTWSGRVTARLLPELQVTSAKLRDCATGGAATTGDTVCVGLEYANVGGPLYQNAFVQCSVTQLSSGGTWKLTLVNIGTVAPNGTGRATPIVGGDLSARLALGQYRTSCIVDPAKAIAESNEANNELVVTSEVILPEYDVATASVIAGTGTCSVTSGQQQYTRPYVVTIRNDGTKELNGVDVSCKYPNRGAPGVGTASYSGVLAPKAKQNVSVCFAPPARASESLYCQATITAPAGVKDQHPSNDGWLGATGAVP